MAWATFNGAILADTKGGLTTYTYDVRNQLTRITQSGTGVAAKRVDFAYDGDGRLTRVDRHVVADTAYFLGRSVFPSGEPTGRAGSSTTPMTRTTGRRPKNSSPRPVTSGRSDSARGASRSSPS